MTKRLSVYAKRECGCIRCDCCYKDRCGYHKGKCCSTECTRQVKILDEAMKEKNIPLVASMLAIDEPTQKARERDGNLIVNKRADAYLKNFIAKKSESI